MRAYIVLLALTVFVAAVLTWENEREDVGKSTKKRIEFIRKFFEEDPTGKQIAQLAKDWNATALEDKDKVRASLDQYCRDLENKTA
uniref:8 kDa glycoprotein n=1 Tax=Echinococcus granulosus TaxID=6210 RepID=B6E487_ECHGR|nr:8 kDa glycoprotein [Echinococcus granulosus]